MLRRIREGIVIRKGSLLRVRNSLLSFFMPQRKNRPVSNIDSSIRILIDFLAELK